MMPRRRRRGTFCHRLEFKAATCGPFILVCGVLLAFCASCEKQARNAPIGPCDSKVLISGSRIPIISPTLVLVRARVSATAIDGDCVQGELTILDVLCGDVSLVRQVFVATSAATSNPKVDYQGAIAPELRLGEVGFWLLRQFKSVWAPEKVVAFGIAWPVRQGVTPRFAEAVELIGAIQAMAHDQDAQSQFEALKEYAGSSTMEVSAWAIDVLAAYGPQNEVSPFLETLVAHGTLAAGAETRADAALLNAVGATWRASPVRERMFDRWVSDSLTEIDGLRAIEWLIDLAQKPNESGVEPARMLALAQIAIENPNWSLKARSRAITIVFWIARIHDDHGAAFDLLTNIIESSEEPHLRLFAANTLRAEVELNDGRREELRALLQRTKDEHVAEILRGLLGLTHSITPNQL